MELTGLNFLGNLRSGESGSTFQAVNPATAEKLPTDFFEATAAEIETAARRAAAAFQVYRLKSGRSRAAFLEAIAAEIIGLGDALIERCTAETGLPAARITGERGRTTGQLELFAALLREGSWVDARIDPADPGRQPLPKPDVRSLQKALGPVGVFGASNFPLAFSVAGGDTVSALAAGCPVIVKAHPAHPGTSEMIACAILRAAAKTNMPDGVFSMVQGISNDVGLGIVTHPAVKAIGFTGSFRGGKALFDAAAGRAEPIPVYAEMGSSNPVFVLEHALAENAAEIAAGLAASVTLGTGQFCTNPGIVVVSRAAEAAGFQSALAKQLGEVPAGVMLTGEICRAFENGVSELAGRSAVETLLAAAGTTGTNRAAAHVFTTKGRAFLSDESLEAEVFGPSTLVVTAEDQTELLEIARRLHGHLTATLFGTETDLAENRELIEILEQKVGRLLINGFPTGVEVCHAMVHGGAFPATTDSRTTSVGTAAIYRFTRPVCYQNFPDFLLPAELQNDNPLGIGRKINGVLTKE
jgi:2,5-dioxopentanoate dehydrogenase